MALEQLGAEYGHERDLVNSDVSSPGLALAGFVGRFVSERAQVIGETEMTYLESISEDECRRNLAQFFSYNIPAVFITKQLTPVAPLVDLAVASGVPLFRSELKTNEFYRWVKPIVEDLLAPMTTLHGSLADVFGVGLLFTGASGIGKSECVLDLVERRHRLVADDLVIAMRRGHDVLIGKGHELQRHYMEIRGVGLIDIPSIFGIHAVRQQKRIEVVVQLKEWVEGAEVDRTGLDYTATSILGVELPQITVHLNPGKNITVISEVIAMNHLLRYSGVDPAQSFNKRLISHMKERSAVQRYLTEDDE
jgi:HPr kinase/phosphorylase